MVLNDFSPRDNVRPTHPAFNSIFDAELFEKYRDFGRVGRKAMCEQCNLGSHSLLWKERRVRLYYIAFHFTPSDAGQTKLLCHMLTTLPCSIVCQPFVNMLGFQAIGV